MRTRLQSYAPWIAVAAVALLVGAPYVSATNIGTNVVVSGTLTVPAAYSLDTASAGVLNLGTTTATSIILGRTGVVTTVGGGFVSQASSTVVGPLTVTGALTFGSPITVGNGGSGLSSAADGALLFGGVGGGTANLTALATSTGGSVLQLSFSTGRPTWVATSTLGFTGANLTIANTWTALQQFQAQASTTLFSSYGPSYFGATATSSFATNGSLSLANNLTVPAGYSLDVAASGALNLGTTTATTINIGGTQATTKVLGVLTVPAAYGLDVSSAGVLNLGTTTATTINIGSITGTTNIKGSLTIPAAYGIDTASAGTLNIGTTSANAITIGKAGVTTNNPGLTTMTNASTTNLSIGGSTGTNLNTVQVGSCTLVSVSAVATTTTFTTCTGAGTVDNTYKVIVQALSTLPSGLLIDAASTTATAGTLSIRVNNVDAGANTSTGAPTITFWAFK